MNDTPQRPDAPAGLAARLWAFVRTRQFAILASAFVAGIVFWGGFNTAMGRTARSSASRATR